MSSVYNIILELRNIKFDWSSNSPYKDPPRHSESHGYSEPICRTFDPAFMYAISISKKGALVFWKSIRGSDEAEMLDALPDAIYDSLRWEIYYWNLNGGPMAITNWLKAQWRDDTW